MRKFAFFLPQFHEIKENNEWWGEGFTEWTNVKKAYPLFLGHKQPKHPKDGRYYNLLDKDTVLWQTELLHKYYVDGLIYYHYYFAGRKLLEKPAENLLSWTDIDQHFFFCWANHSWIRSWEGKRDVLIEQVYGEEDDWEEHFQYLLPFFQDKRYEKVDNKPLFMLFKSDFSEKKDMFEYFDKRCLEYGFDGIALIETFFGTKSSENELSEFVSCTTKQTKYIFFREYTVSINLFTKYQRFYFYRILKKIGKVMNYLITKNRIDVYDGNILYKIIKDIELYREDIIHGLFFEWDNTPRHGKRGLVINPPTKRMFMKTMDHMANEKYIFFNAWNEWAEGMVLEPSEENGYKYLEWIKEWSEKKDNVERS